MRKASILCSALLILSIAHWAFAKDPYEATTWKITVTPDDDARGAGERPFDDTITFRGSKFVSEHFKAKGFDAAEFDDNANRGTFATFTANTKSDKNGTAKWTGSTTGPNITGDLVWTKADGTVVNFSFSGEKKEG